MSAALADESVEPWESRLFERIRNYFDGNLLPRLEHVEAGMSAVN